MINLLANNKLYKHGGDPKEAKLKNKNKKKKPTKKTDSSDHILHGRQNAEI